jgi:hypothetical protein
MSVSRFPSVGFPSVGVPSVGFPSVEYANTKGLKLDYQIVEYQFLSSRIGLACRMSLDTPIVDVSSMLTQKG